MGGQAGCLLDVSQVSPEVVADLAERRGVSTLFLRGPMSVPALWPKAPVTASDGRMPGVRLVEDDAAFRAALDAARGRGMDTYVTVENPLVGSADWADLLAEDNGGRSAGKIDPEHPVLCPNRPRLLEWLSDLVVELVGAYRPMGVLLCDVSLGSPASVDNLFTCWCDLCQARVGELGYDPDRVRIGMQGARTKLAEIRPEAAQVPDVGLGLLLDAVGFDIGLMDWFNFRADSVSACLYEMRQALAEKDTSVRVAILHKGPTAAMLSGQRREDALRDTTIADVYLPVICGAGSGVLAMIAGHARQVHDAAEGVDEPAALALAARVHGYDGVPLPDRIAELAESPAAELVRASAGRELALTRAAPGGVPRWPAIDCDGLPAGVLDDVVARVEQTDAEGILYIGVPE
ncbi:MAG: hypothetical protein R6V58_00895 [Planctomycetota bacterium]